MALINQIPAFQIFGNIVQVNGLKVAHNGSS